MTCQPTHIARRASTLVLAGLLATAALAAGPFARAAEASYTAPTLSRFDAHLLADINHARSIRGLRTLTVVAGTTDIAHGWSCHLAGTHLLAHNGRLAAELPTHGSQYWTTYAENVGDVPATAGADRLFSAYMHSPEHRANILYPAARFVGIWSKRSNGFRFNTIDFVGSTTRSYSNTYGATRTSC